MTRAVQVLRKRACEGKQLVTKRVVRGLVSRKHDTGAYRISHDTKHRPDQQATSFECLTARIGCDCEHGPSQPPTRWFELRKAPRNPPGKDQPTFPPLLHDDERGPLLSLRPRRPGTTVLYHNEHD